MEQFRIFNDRFFLSKSSQCMRSRPIKSAEKDRDQEPMIFPDYFRNTTEPLRSVHTSCLSKSTTHFSNAAKRLMQRINEKKHTYENPLDCMKSLHPTKFRNYKSQEHGPINRYYRVQEKHNYLNSDYTKVLTLINGVSFKQITPTASICRSNNGTLVRDAIARRRWWTIKDFNHQTEGSLVWTQRRFIKITQKIAQKCAKGLEVYTKTHLGLKGNQIALFLGCPEMKQIGSIIPPYCNEFDQYFQTIPSSQVIPRLHNHIADPTHLCRVKKLLVSLNETYGDLTDMIPKTVIVSNSVQLAELLKNLNDFSRSGVLFFKQAGPNQNYSKVSHILSKREAILGTLKKSKKGEQILIQQFINPLVRSRKIFRLHTYLLITVVDGFIKAYWYAGGYATQKNYQWFKFQTLAAIHRQSLCQLLAQGCHQIEKVLLDQLLEYFTVQEMIKMKSDMAQIAGKVVKAVHKTLNVVGQSLAFELFQMKFVVGEECKVFLTGIKQNPSFENTLWNKDLMSHLIENVFKIAIDPIFPSPYDQMDPSQFYRTNKFRLVFDELQ